MGLELNIQSLNVEVSGKQVLTGLNLKIKQGEIHAIMGPNGSGKSTLASSILKRPGYVITSGSIFLDETEITDKSAYEIAKLKLFVSTQNPIDVPGVSVMDLLRNSTTTDKSEAEIMQLAELLSIKGDMLNRGLNVELSGGEKKRLDILQMLALEPAVCILDELDSGLDVDALDELAKLVYDLSAVTSMTVLVITHYARILKVLKPSSIHVLQQGKIVKTGDFSLAEELEVTGYEKF
jgi:Fe-S cluster assembly ATP-binding protein